MVTGLLQHLLALPAWLALFAVFAMPALESSAFLGFIFPGELTVLLGGVVASQGRLPLAAVIAAGVAGAVVGDAVGYLVGRCCGRRILDSSLGRFVNARHLDRAEKALARRGGPAVFLGRFTVALRVLVPGLAGMARMPYRTFAVFNASGALAWASGMVLAGYLAGSHWRTAEHLISRAGLVLTLFLVGGFLVVRAVLRHRTSRAGIGGRPDGPA